MTVSDRAIRRRWVPPAPALTIAFVVIGCMVYANLSLAVKKRENLKYFPPFAPGIDVSLNWDLGSENYHIARSIEAGKGFANPFGDPTGPTAWATPLLPALLAALWRLCAGNRLIVLLIVLAVQSTVLIGTGLLVLVIAGRTSQRVGPWTVAICYLAVLLCGFRECFQTNGDCWTVSLVIDVMLVGFFWYAPLQSTSRSVAWGFFGGVSALINPIAAFAWGAYSVARGIRQRAWLRTGLLLAVAGLVVTPWTVRNYLVLGRLIPVKSNLAYEVYQSQCLQSDGLLNTQGQYLHPIHPHTRERRSYQTLGEIVYLDRKAEQAANAIAADPLDWLNRVAARFVGATLWYVPVERAPHTSAAAYVWTLRLLQPLPFLALMVLIFVGIGRGLTRVQWTAIAIYSLYLTPYIIVSYYPRYGFPLIAAKVLFMVWALDWVVGLRFRRSEKEVPYVLSA